MKTIVALEGLSFWAFHGYYNEERKKGNDFICDVNVELKSFDSLDDNINDTVDYELIYDIIQDEMAETKKLIETVALKIIERIRVLDNVVAAKVKIYKMNPPIKGKATRALVEMRF